MSEVKKLQGAEFSPARKAAEAEKAKAAEKAEAKVDASKVAEKKPASPRKLVTEFAAGKEQAIRVLLLHGVSEIADLRQQASKMSKKPVSVATVRSQKKHFEARDEFWSRREAQTKKAFAEFKASQKEKA